MRRLIFSLAVAVLGFVSVAPDASALSLDTLVNGGSLTSGNGRLVFDDFEVIATGSVSSDLSIYKVVALVDGFAITGPIAAARGNEGDLFIEYTVSATTEIIGAKLRFNGATHGRGSSASVTETFEEPVDVELFVFATGRSGRNRMDRLDLEGFTQLRVASDILVDSSGRRSLATISRIEQRFRTRRGEPVPEPAALLLTGAALVVLAAARRRSARGAA